MFTENVVYYWKKVFLTICKHFEAIFKSFRHFLDTTFRVSHFLGINFIILSFYQFFLEATHRLSAKSSHSLNDWVFQKCCIIMVAKLWPPPNVLIRLYRLIGFRFWVWVSWPGKALLCESLVNLYFIFFHVQVKRNTYRVVQLKVENLVSQSVWKVNFLRTTLYDEYESVVKMFH